MESLSRGKERWEEEILELALRRYRERGTVPDEGVAVGPFTVQASQRQPGPAKLPGTRH